LALKRAKGSFHVARQVQTFDRADLLKAGKTDGEALGLSPGACDLALLGFDSLT
jgi:hypothetical protein